MPRRGYTTQPRGFNPGAPKPHRALKGRQTEHGEKHAFASVYHVIISQRVRTRDKPRPPRCRAVVNSTDLPV